MFQIMSATVTTTMDKPGTKVSEPRDGGSSPGPRAIIVNGEQRLSEAATLAALIVEAGYGDAKLATALNGEFVAARNRAETTINEGDHIEIVAPRQGG